MTRDAKLAQIHIQLISQEEHNTNMLKLLLMHTYRQQSGLISLDTLLLTILIFLVDIVLIAHNQLYIHFSVYRESKMFSYEFVQK